MTTASTQNLPPGFSRWDVTDHVKTEEDMQLYLDACVGKDSSVINAWRAACNKLLRISRVSLTCFSPSFCVLEKSLT